VARCSDDPLVHVISFRVTDAEKSALEKLASFHGVKVSTLMRETVYLLEEVDSGANEQLFGRAITKMLSP